MDRYNEYHDQLAILYNRYGDSNTWPLEIRAQASQLAMDFGFEWLRGMVCILPGEGDFTQEEAVACAAGLAKEAFGVDVGTATNTKVSFYYTTDNPEQRLWQVRFWMGEGQRDCSITMDAAGTLDGKLAERLYQPGASYADDGGRCCRGDGLLPARLRRRPHRGGNDAGAGGSARCARSSWKLIRPAPSASTA